MLAQVLAQVLAQAPVLALALVLKLVPPMPMWGQTTGQVATEPMRRMLARRDPGFAP